MCPECVVRAEHESAEMIYLEGLVFCPSEATEATPLVP